MNELFIEPSPNYSWSIWFIYNPICFIDIVVVISPMLPFFDISYIVSFFPVMANPWAYIVMLSNRKIKS